jgi:hypothetical protein
MLKGYFLPSQCLDPEKKFFFVWVIKLGIGVLISTQGMSWSVPERNDFYFLFDLTPNFYFKKI